MAEPSWIVLPAAVGFHRDQRSTGFQGLAKELSENLFFVTISYGVLFPNKRIGGHGVKVGEILCPQRPEIEEFAPQNGLEIKGHP